MPSREALKGEQQDGNATLYTAARHRRAKNRPTEAQDNMPGVIEFFGPCRPGPALTYVGVGGRDSARSRSR